MDQRDEETTDPTAATSEVEILIGMKLSSLKLVLIRIDNNNKKVNNTITLSAYSLVPRNRRHAPTSVVCSSTAICT